MDIAGFLSGYPPFDAFSPERLDALAKTVEIEHFAAGATILHQGGESADALHVVRKGSVELLDGVTVIDLLGEGEVFGELSLLSKEPPTLSVRAHEDTLCYRIPREAAEEAFSTTSGGSLVLGRVRRRITALTEEGRAGSLGPQYRTLDALVRRAPVTCPAGATVGDAAALMMSNRVSCLLIQMRGGWGILTDRDLRSRVVAARREFDTPVERVATFPVSTLPADSMAGEALLEMFALGVHHFPVTGPDGAILGVVTDTDLMGIGRHTPFAIRSAIERAPDRHAAVAAARELPEVVCALVDSSADPIAVGHVVALVIDTLTRRMIELRIEQKGEPPGPWAWLALGSAARHEQALHTDQDHALAFDPVDEPAEQVDPYFADIAEFVTSGLEDAGIPRCKGDAMATHPSLRRSVGSWVEAFRGWMQDVSREGSILSSIAADYRKVVGPLDIEPALDGIVGEARTNLQFMRHLAHRALDMSPPTGFLRDLVVESKGEHQGALDVKHGGITIIGNLGRAYAISAGAITQKRTLGRLEAAAIADKLDDETARELAEAFRFLWEVRLRHQVEQVRMRKEPDDFVDPATLGPVARRGLREAFRVIARAQKGLATELGVRPP